jgi:proteasome accessory factor B
MATTPDSSERLFNLTCALATTKRGLLKSEIFSQVQGYRERYNPSDTVAINKLFERDKKDLAKSGVLVQAYIPAEEDTNNQEYRYLIPNESFIWPKGFKLSAEQVGLLNLAAQVWAKATISNEVDQAMMRLRALGETSDDEGLLGVAPRIRTVDSNFAALTNAIENRSTISFEYRKAGQSVETRTVQPWLLRSVGGQWLLVSWDEDRQATRNFLLRRIVKKRVTDLQRTFTKPTSEQLTAAERELNQLIEQQVATLRVKPDTAAWVHFELDLPGVAQNGNEISLHFMDRELLASDLRAFAGQFEAVRPQSLANDLRAGLEQVVHDHA